MTRLSSVALLLGALLLASPAAAVLCSSYVTRGDCEGKMTSSGGCSWNGVSCFTDPSIILPEGMAAVTSVGDELPPLRPGTLPLEPAPGPEAERGP
jgi:hypothetical protein